MATIRYMAAGAENVAAGVENVETIPDELVPFYQNRPGYTLVVDEADAAALTGAELLEAARNAGVEAPTTLTADEKRQAIVEATAPTFNAGGSLPAVPATIVNDTGDGVPVITPDPEADPAPATKRRTAAKES